jgi:hypothetical protein
LQHIAKKISPQAKAGRHNPKKKEHVRQRPAPDIFETIKKDDPSKYSKGS